MKTAKLEKPRCLSCGSKLASIDGEEHFRCRRCGEEYDISGLQRMELDLDDFDKLLLFSLRKNRKNDGKVKAHRMIPFA
jgi:predicted amidophosphoribosyltransferase